MGESDSTVAEQVARAAIDFERRRTVHREEVWERRRLAVGQEHGGATTK